MPNRILKESICYSDDLDCLTAFEETVFYRLMVRVDDFGRIDARPAFLRSQLFTTRPDIAEEHLSAAIDRLAEIGLVACYTVEDKPYLYLVSWKKHQRLRSMREKYPAPPEAAIDGSALSQSAINCSDLQQAAAICNDLQQAAATCSNLPQAAADCDKLLQVAAHAGAESESQSQSQSQSQSESERESESRTEAQSQSGPGRFIPPTVEQVADYCTRRKNSVSAQRFVDFYASKGWMIGHSPMADWRAAVRRWEEDAATGTARAGPADGRLSTAKNYESEDCI